MEKGGQFNRITIAGEINCDRVAGSGLRKKNVIREEPERLHLSRATLAIYRSRVQALHGAEVMKTFTLLA